MVSLDELEINRKDKKIDELEKKAAFKAAARANREKKLMTTIETRDRKIKKLEEQLAALNGADEVEVKVYVVNLVRCILVRLEKV